MNDFLKTLAPTLASALLGPFGGVAVTALGKALGVDNATVESVSKVIAGGKVSPEALAEIQKLEMEYRDHEAERGFKYAEIAFKDRDSARQANVAGGTMGRLFTLSLLLLVATLGCEIWVLFRGYPPQVPDIIVGRVLGLMDAVAMMVLSFWYGTTNGSHQKTELLAQSAPSK